MNTVKIKELQNFVKWVAAVSSYSASVDVTFTSYGYSDESKLSYTLWVSDDLYYKTHESIDELLQEIPALKKTILSELLDEVA